MGIDSSKEKFFSFIKNQFSAWQNADSISKQDFIRFFSTIKKLASQLQLKEFSDQADQCMKTLDEVNKRILYKKDWQRLLTPFITFLDTFENRSLQTVENNLQINHDKEFILLIDDDVDFVTLAKHILEKEGFLLIVAPNGKRGLEMIYDFKPSVILIDIHLPDMDGFIIFESIVTKLKKNHTPIIIISGDDSKENRIRAYQMGAIDFISKPIDKDLFIANLKNRIRLRNEIEQAVIVDELTSLYNRKYMNTQLMQHISQYNRNKTPFSIVLLDLDHFKLVNDTYGHLMGDDVLRKFATLVNESKRENDIICRYGGEEFIVILPNTSKEQAYHFLNRLKKVLSEVYFYANDESFQITFSAGITEINEKNNHPKKLIDEADKALYHAKMSGRNQFITYNTSLQSLNNLLKITIVIVEDSHLIRHMLVNYFSNWRPSDRYEINVVSYSNGIDFLNSNWYKPKEKYIILLDGIMPGMDGLEVLKKVRENYTTDNVLISMLTGRKGEEHIIHALRNGADDYIIKPFVAEEVSERILRLINRVFV